MFNQKNKNTCKSALTLEQYLNSCPISRFDLRAVGTMEKLTSLSNAGRGFLYTLDFLRNNWEDNGFIDYIKHPQKIFEDGGRLPSPEAINAVKEELPKIFSGLWITNKENPKQISNTLENFIKQSKKLEGYQTIIWTNIDPSKLKEMNPLLEAENIIVKNIADLNTENTKLLDFVTNPKNYISNNIHSYNGVIIDVAKYLIIEKGGIIVDLNFEFDQDFKQSNLENHDFIATNTGFNRLENGFFVAKPHHVIFKELLNIIDEMLNNPECSLKQFRETAELFHATELLSMMPLAMAYMKYNNINNNNDATIYKWGSKKSYSPDISKIQYHEKIGAQLENKDFEDFAGIAEENLGELGEYLLSYITFIGQREANFNCIEEPIGDDNIWSATWQDAGIV